MKNNIITSNNKLGIATHFFYDPNGVCGYAKGNSIYLNEFYQGQLEIISKHEILHFFENSANFKKIKEFILDLIDTKEMDKLKEVYRLKYYGLYSEEEINEGVLDNEIVIDLIVKNGDFKVNIDDYIKDAYSYIVNAEYNINLTVKGKKYLSLTPSRNMANRYRGLSKWDLLFANEYYKGKAKPTGKDRYDQITKDAFFLACELLDEKYLENIYVSNSSPYLERRLKEIILGYKARGEYKEAESLSSDISKSLDFLANVHSFELKKQFYNIQKILKNSEYEDSFKCLLIRETLNKTYRYEKGNKIIDKRELHKTILPFMIFNDFVVKEIYNNVDKYNNFSDLYFYALDKYNKEFLASQVEIQQQDDLGYWIKFSCLDETKVQGLENLIKNTSWCTKKMAGVHLKDGDFYVFVDYQNNPHIAVKMTGNKIEEVRGIKGDSDQEIEDDYRCVAIEFLKKNIEIEGAQEWLDKEVRNENLNKFLIKIRTNTLMDSDLDDLIENLNSYEEHLHGNINSNEIKLIEEIRNNKEIRDMIASICNEEVKVLIMLEEMEKDKILLGFIEKFENSTIKENEYEELMESLSWKFEDARYEDSQRRLTRLINTTNNGFREWMASKFDCSVEEIYIGKLEKNRGFLFKDKKCPYKYILGDANLIRAADLDMSKLEYVKGNIVMTLADNVDLSSLKEIDGDLDIVEAKDIVFGDYLVVGGEIATFGYKGNLNGVKFINMKPNKR